MDVELRVVDLLLIFHQLPVLYLFWSIFLLFTEARPLKADKSQSCLVEAARTTVDIEHVNHGLSAKILASDDLVTEKLN